MISVDFLSAIVLVTALGLTFGAYVVGSLAAGRPLVANRVEREAALPLLGKAPMHAVYRAIVPIGRFLVAHGVHANVVSVVALFVAVLAAVAFGTGHFGIAASVAAVASLADGLDGLVARLAGTQSRMGQVLDTTIDRYVDALFLGGILVFVRHELAPLLVCLGAVVGSFMVSYASSVERELGVESGAVPMRRAHRLAYLLGAATLAPIVGRLVGDARVELFVVLVAALAIAVVGNVSAVRRLLAAARVATEREDAATRAKASKDERLDVESHAQAPLRASR